ncbi:hypothetical protein SynMEDNS5_02339 [Synechococcus sp. MEDNS5]|nr:hypothetical protein SynMEDNS5_02339 [Synechococcus sp. MEDNS5]
MKLSLTLEKASVSLLRGSATTLETSMPLQLTMADLMQV